jgi:ribosomal protein S18 acetylase RimI-like enzyme
MHLVEVNTELLFQEVDAMYQQTFGAASVPTHVQYSWWKVWPAGIAALQHHEVLAGAISCWPVKRAVYEALCAGMQQEKQIQATDIETECPQYFHLSEIVVLPAYRHRSHTAMLVQYMLNMLQKHLQASGEIFLTAYAYSEQGARLMQYLQMQQLLPASATADGQSLWHIGLSDTQQLAAIKASFAV